MRPGIAASLAGKSLSSVGILGGLLYRLRVVAFAVINGEHYTSEPARCRVQLRRFVLELDR
jgi:hypothetical protein